MLRHSNSKPAIIAPANALVEPSLAEARKRVLLIAAAILAAWKLAQHL